MGDKLGNKSLDIYERDSLPSDLSEDEWTEIVKFQKEKFDEEKKKKLEEFADKRKMIKETLDKQLREQHQRKLKEKSEKSQFD